MLKSILAIALIGALTVPVMAAEKDRGGRHEDKDRVIIKPEGRDHDRDRDRVIVKPEGRDHERDRDRVIIPVPGGRGS
jgi:hypothetical protein